MGIVQLALLKLSGFRSGAVIASIATGRNINIMSFAIILHSVGLGKPATNYLLIAVK